METNFTDHMKWLFDMDCSYAELKRAIAWGQVAEFHKHKSNLISRIGLFDHLFIQKIEDSSIPDTINIVKPCNLNDKFKKEESIWFNLSENKSDYLAIKILYSCSAYCHYHDKMYNIPDGERGLELAKDYTPEDKQKFQEWYNKFVRNDSYILYINKEMSQITDKFSWCDKISQENLRNLIDPKISKANLKNFTISTDGLDITFQDFYNILLVDTGLEFDWGRKTNIKGKTHLGIPLYDLHKQTAIWNQTGSNDCNSLQIVMPAIIDSLNGNKVFAKGTLKRVL